MPITKSAYSVYPDEIRSDLKDEQDEKGFEYTELLSIAGNGKWLEFPNGIKGAMVELEITSGVGYVEATGSALSRVRDNTAVGIQWDQGQVSGTAQDYVVPVTAIRLVNVSGSVRMNVRLQ